MLILKGEDLTWREVDGEVVVLQLADSRYLRLNSTGGALWRALSKGSTEDDLVTLLVTGHGATAEMARGDVRAFLDDLRSRQLLTGD